MDFLKVVGKGSNIKINTYYSSLNGFQYFKIIKKRILSITGKVYFWLSSNY